MNEMEKRRRKKIIHNYVIKLITHCKYENAAKTALLTNKQTVARLNGDSCSFCHFKMRAFALK